jgi:hypothetical protein
VLGVPGETGVSGDCGTVFGLDGLKTGGGDGGTGFTNCACACSIATPKHASHPAKKNFASAIRSDLVVCIVISCETMFRLRYELTTLGPTLSFAMKHAGWHARWQPCLTGNRLLLPGQHVGFETLTDH